MVAREGSRRERGRQDAGPSFFCPAGPRPRPPLRRARQCLRFAFRAFFGTRHARDCRGRPAFWPPPPATSSSRLCLLPALRIPLPFAPFVPPSALTSLATGIAALDAVLPGRGIPKGRLTEIVGVLGSGRTTLARQLAKATIAHGLRVACVDATRTLDPRGWAGLCAAGVELLVVRPTERARGAWCADILLRSGAFALVLLDGAPPLSRSVTVRLTRLARDAEAAF